MNQVPRIRLSEAQLQTVSGTASQQIFYRSEDGTRLAGVFAESGKLTVTYSYDEFLYVTAGKALCEVEGGERFTLEAGDAALMRNGQTINFVLSEDFCDVVFMVGTTPLPY